MKIITLIPIKNEAWVLPVTLPPLSRVSDEVILLDDNSQDNLTYVTSSLNNVRIEKFSRTEKFVNMSNRRNELLRLGRERGGTHFIFLDADELFTENSISGLLKLIKTLKPGESLALPWINLTERSGKLFYNKNDEWNYKDFIFYDDGESQFPDVFLSEQRTPTSVQKWTKMPFEKASILHLQFLAKERYQYKQAWYRMQEFIAGKRSAIRINTTYLFTKNLQIGNTVISDRYLESKLVEFETSNKAEILKNQIKDLFANHGVQYFEPLDIWNIPELHELFTKQTGREPKPSLAPNWVLYLNNKKNKIKNLYHARSS